MTSRVPLRLRVAGAFALTAVAALVGLGAFVYYRVEAALEHQARASLETRLDALARIPPAGQGEAVEAMTGDSFAQVLGVDGAILASSPQLESLLAPPPDLGREDAAAQQEVMLVGEDESEAAQLLMRRQGGRILVVGSARDEVEDALGGVLAQLVVGVPLAVVLASALGYVVAGSALRPIEQMRRHAARISDQSPDDRLPLPDADDEVRRLGVTLNAMLDRLEAALIRERRFVAEASHELRTPLALLRMELDLALSRQRSREELLASLTSANEEVERLSRLSDDLLLLAASDRGGVGLAWSEVDVRTLLQHVVDRFATQALAHGRRVTVTDSGPVLVHADRDRLERAVSNLVDNALRHGEGDVEVSARADGARITIRVRDRGRGFGPDLRDRAFDRFSRDRSDPGSAGLGLGLAIVRAIVDEHHGMVRISEDSNGAATVVEIDLPSAQPGENDL
jgi:heavy metal sensor kinase